MDYIEVIENSDQPTTQSSQELDFSSFYADYYCESSSDYECEYSVLDKEEDYESLSLKELMRIRDYYNYVAKIEIPKSKKQTKKNDIINYILEFESNITNIDIVIRRAQLWKYADELKNDKYMKQFIFWS